MQTNTHEEPGNKSLATAQPSPYDPKQPKMILQTSSSVSDRSADHFSDDQRNCFINVEPDLLLI